MRKIGILTILLALAACSGQVDNSRPTIPFVESILEDSQSAAYRMIASFDEHSSKGMIAVVGESDRVAAMAARLAAADNCDNVDGRVLADGLPDFAGEEILSLADSVRYSRYVADGTVELLRERTVRGLLAAVEGGAKAVVLASPLMSEYGHFDIDTLLRSVGKDIPVILPIELAADKALAEAAGRPVAVLTDQPEFLDGMYARLMTGSECFIARADTLGGDVLRNLLRTYGSGRIAVLVVDDPTVDPGEIEASLQDIRETDPELARLLTGDFHIVDSMREAECGCAAILRQKNIYTHNISFPKVIARVL